MKKTKRTESIIYQELCHLGFNDEKSDNVPSKAANTLLWRKGQCGEIENKE